MSCHHHTLACFASDGLPIPPAAWPPPPFLQGLFQATSDCTEQQAAFQAERAEREEAAGVLRAQVQQLQALGAAREHELQVQEPLGTTPSGGRQEQRGR